MGGRVEAATAQAIGNCLAFHTACGLLHCTNILVSRDPGYRRNTDFLTFSLHLVPLTRTGQTTMFLLPTDHRVVSSPVLSRSL